MPTFETEKVDRIEIKSKNNQVLLKKQDGQWVIEIPSQSGAVFRKADETNVQAMLDAARDLRHSHYVTNQKEKFHELGVEGEEATIIHIFSGDKAVWSLALGKNATGSGRYGKIPDDQEVHVMRGSFWQLTRNEPADWRDREIMPIKEGEIKAFKLKKHQAVYVSLENDKDKDEWQINQAETTLPAGYRPNKAELANLVRAVLNMRATNFVDTQPTDLKEPSLVVESVTNDKTYVLEFFPKGENYLARRVGDDQVYEISKYNFERINKSLEDLRDLALFKLDKSQIVKLTLQGTPSPIIVSKKDNQWQIEQPKSLSKDFDFDPVMVDDMIALVAGLHGQRLADPKKDISLDKNWQNTWLLELATKEDEKIHLFATKSVVKDESLVKGNIDGQVYVVKSSRLTSFYNGINAFKKEEFELPPIDENTQGFKNLPVDIQRKLLDATKKKQ
jgi:hypothetical protein